jgi:hypothetical protein
LIHLPLQAAAVYSAYKVDLVSLASYLPFLDQPATVVLPLFTNYLHSSYPFRKAKGFKFQAIF